MATGYQTVTVRSAQPGSLDRKNIPVTNYVNYTWPNVSIQPVKVHETVSNIDYEINKYHCIGPANTVGLAIKTTDQIVDSNSLVYRIIGNKILPKFNGIPHHVELMLEVPSAIEQSDSSG